MFGRSATVEDIDRLIVKKKYSKALEVVRAQLSKDSTSVRWRQQLADLLALDGQISKAVKVLRTLASDLVGNGFDAKGIALLKKIQRLEPGHDNVEDQITTLIQKRHKGAGLRNRLPKEDEYEREQEEKKEQEEKAYREPTEAVLVRLPEEAHPYDQLPLELRGVSTSPLFSNFSHEELLAFIQGLQLQTLEPGEIIVTEGEPGDSLFVLASGSVRVYVRNKEKRSEPVRLLHQGEFFGEISLLTSAPRTATIVCATDCELLTLDRAGLTEIAQQNPQVPFILHDIYCRRADSAEERKARGEQLPDF